ncbi:bestrophin-like domain [Streptomyces sp. NPDC054956]
MTITLVVAVLALAAGIAANKFLRPRLMKGADAEGMGVRDLVGPLLTLTILILAFMLVTASSSNGRADDAARAEAHSLDHLAEVADFAPPELRRRLRGDALCYARAVEYEEWPAMATGKGSSVPSVWSRDFRKAFKELGTGDPTFGLLVAADNQRSLARQARMAESTPTIPSLIYWFMLVNLGVTVVGLGLCLPRTDNKGPLAALVVVTALLTATLLIIRDVDRPFGGVIVVKPTLMAETKEETARDFVADYKAEQIPCDERGRAEPPRGGS